MMDIIRLTEGKGLRVFLIRFDDGREIEMTESEAEYILERMKEEIG